MTVEFAGVNASDWILTETGQWTGKWETGQWWTGFSRYMLSNTDLKAIEANIAQHCMFQQHDEITNYITLVILSGTASSMQNLRILQSNHFFIGPKIWSLQFLLHPRERLRSIVISTSVCVCLSVCKDISRTTCAILTDFCGFCLWPWLNPPLAGWWNPKRNRQFWGFYSPITMHWTA